MKCPECGENQPYSSGMTCKKCGRQFVLDPKKDRWADGKFLAAVSKASSNGTYYYTANQLFAEYARRQATAGTLTGCGCFMVLIAGMTTIGVLTGQLSWPVPVGFAMAALGFFVAQAFVSSSPPSRDEFDRLLQKWLQSEDRGRLEMLITEPSLHEPPPEWPEPDIYDYGVERILVVDDDLLVDVLVRNGFHTENRCLVLSVAGYPSYITERAVVLLEANPQLQVFLLHGSGFSGSVMRQAIERVGLLPLAGHPVTDLGLNPEDLKRMKGLRALRPDRQEQGLPADTLLYGTLAAGLGVAVVEGLVLSQLLDQSRRADTTSTTASFG